MKNKKEFKNSILEKRDLYYADKRKKQLRFTKIATPVAACFVIAFAVFLSPLKNMFIPNDEANIIDHMESQVDDGNNIISLSISISSNTETDDSIISSTNSEQIYSITSYINNLEFSEVIDSVDETAPDIFIITINFVDSTSKTYTLRSDGYLKEGKKGWQRMNDEQTATLMGLIAEISSNS